MRQSARSDSTKRAFIIHAWGSTPESNWIPWLRKELAKKGFAVHVPQMPNTDNPKMEEWIEYADSLIENPDKDTYLVGHSMGCQTILRYLERLDKGEKVGGVLLVAGFVNIKKEAMKGDAKTVLTPWVDSKIDLQKAKAHSHKFVSIASDNDPYISLDDSEIFKRELGAKSIVIPNAGHFTISLGGYKELHIALNEILKMIQ